MTGTLYVIGVGPGDPELLTLKAVRILRAVKCICVPKGREEGSSMALNIIKKIINMDDKEMIEAYFPMRKTKGSAHARELDTKWNETVETVLSILNKGADMAFITIGDPTIYSTFFYLYDRLLEINPLLSIEIIPGISSITASAAQAGISLGLADERIAVLPATYANDIGMVLEHFDTVILMKVHKVFDQVLAMLDASGLTGKALYISRTGMDDEQVVRDIGTLRGKELNYFSMVIIKK
ncbi:MAG TPA: precorrin-2 C(20)-methyltransferase [Dissulfurispiraceae bacterium]|nr:precorrin-2 C(20)-methyltransferase [Dissulfurispiraceae bacterium]